MILEAFLILNAACGVGALVIAAFRGKKLMSQFRAEAKLIPRYKIREEGDAILRDIESHYQEAVKDTLVLMREDALGWSYDGITLNHDQAEIGIWMSNDIKHRRFYRCPYDHLELNHAEKVALDASGRALILVLKGVEREIKKGDKP